MGWDSDDIIINKVKGEILKERYAGCVYHYLSSYSPIVIRHRGEITAEERVRITSLFPDFIRVEFQQTTENWTSVWGMGELPIPISIETMSESMVRGIIEIFDRLSKIREAQQKEK